MSRGVLRGVHYRRVLGSVYVDAHVAVTPRVQAEAALLLTPGAVVSHQTALSLWTADDRAGDVVHVTVERDPRRAFRGSVACAFTKYGASSGYCGMDCR